MVTILLHSSKTMRPANDLRERTQNTPILARYADQLISYLKTLSNEQIQKSMALSAAKATEVTKLIQDYSPAHPTLPAIDIFLGDIYSGLQSQSFTHSDREYANSHLFILSGLYGILRALDEIQPYRLEMGCKFPDLNPYTFWGDKIAQQLPKHQTIINLSAVEYTKAVFAYFKNIDGLKDVTVITPKFLTVSPKTGEPTFVTVHAKIARGAYARWLIQNRVETLDTLKSFNEIGYTYSAALSTPEQPVFVAKVFKGLGLSVRLSKG